MTTVQADNIVLATGSRPIEIPGFKFDGNRVVDSTGALAFAEIPRRLVVIGGGYIGIEIGTLYAKLGAHVTVVEALPSILTGTDPELGQLVARKLKKLGVEVVTGAKAKSWVEKGDRAVVTLEVGDKGEAATIDADKVLVAVGRRPNYEGLGSGGAGRAGRARLRPGGSLHEDQRGRHLRHRRSRRPAHAGPQGVAGGRGGGGGDCRAPCRDGRPLHTGGDLQRSRRSPPRASPPTKRRRPAARSKSASFRSRRWDAPSPTPTPMVS